MDTSGEGSAGAGDTASKRITAVDIQQKEFRVSFRGYNEREVDEFLDVVTEEVARLQAENKRLMEQAEYHQTVPLGGEAEAVLRRAKDEAERIIADARSRTASIGGRGAPAAPDAESGFDFTEAMNRYLGREREFLQALASRIHEHIEAVKSDAQDVRAVVGGGAPARPPGFGTGPSGPLDQGTAGSDTGSGASTPGSRAPEPPLAPPPSSPEPSGGSSGPAADSGPPTQRWDEPPVARLEAGPSVRTSVVERSLSDSMPVVMAPEIDAGAEAAAEPEPEAASPSDPAWNIGHVAPETLSSATPPVDAGDDRTLRELFWGED